MKPRVVKISERKIEEKAPPDLAGWKIVETGGPAPEGKEIEAPKQKGLFDRLKKLIGL